MYAPGCMYRKKDNTLCNRAALQGYSYCKQHTNILLKESGRPPLPSAKQTAKQTKKQTKQYPQQYYQQYPQQFPMQQPQQFPMQQPQQFPQQFPMQQPQQFPMQQFPMVGNPLQQVKHQFLARECPEFMKMNTEKVVEGGETFRDIVLNLIRKFSPHSDHNVMNEYTLDRLMIVVSNIARQEPQIKVELSKILTLA
jgi:hypothetical protein